MAFLLSSRKQAILTLMIGSALLFLGHGLQVTLLPIRAQNEGFSTTVIGLLGTAFFAGFAVGCLLGPKVIQQVGHIRSFAGFAALAAAGILAFPLLVDPIAWTLLRAFTGICFAVLYMVIESWLNDQATNEMRGAVLSIYIIVTNVVIIGGQLMVNLEGPQGYFLFSLIAILVCLSLVPLCLTNNVTPKPLAQAKVRIGRLFRISPVGFVGCVIVGLVEGAFWSLGPVFGQGRGMAISEVTFFMGAFMAGGTISQWPIGSLSDRIDRRYVIAGCCLVTVATGLTIAFLETDSRLIMLGLAALHGAFMLPVYPLCLAHANDYAPTEDLVETSSALLLVYGAGAVIGPVAAAPLMEHLGLGLLFIFVSGLLGLLALYSAYRALRRPVADDPDRVEFVPVPRTSPSVYSLETDDDPLPENDVEDAESQDPQSSSNQ
ncbi:MAG: MFS transporter [Pseudomonadota bacterium]